MTLRRAAPGVAGVVFALLLTGCGGPTLHPVSGKITLDGKPVRAAAVMFKPVGYGQTATAVTAADGTYQLATGGRPGAASGSYEVTITKQRAAGRTRAGETARTGNVTVEYLVPQRYSTPGTSQLHVSVPAEPSLYNFALTSR
jgi:hypothetical protein